MVYGMKQLNEESRIDATLANAERLYGYFLQDPENGPLYLRALDAQLTAGHMIRVEEMLKQAPASQIHLTEFRHLKGLCEIALNHLDQAKGTFAEIIIEQPLLMAPRINYAHVLALLGQYEIAAAEMAMLEVGDLPREGMQLRLRVHYHLGNLDAVVEEAKFWLTKVDPQDIQVAGLLSSALLDNGNEADAAQWAKYALERGSNVDAYAALGMLLLGAGNLDEAQSHFREALRLDKRSGRSWLGLGFVHLLEGNEEAGEQALNQASILFPGYIGTWHILGWRALSKGQVNAAQNYFQKAFALNRSFADTHGGLAAVAVALGDLALARHHIDAGLRLDSKSFAVEYARSLVVAAEGNSQAGADIVQRLLSQTLPNGQNLRSLIGQMVNR